MKLCLRCAFVRVAMLIVLSVLPGGCGGGPRGRMGSMPFPGPLTIFQMGDASDLGTHHYSKAPRAAHATSEHGRGILYTCRGGFLDLAHVRNTIDWVCYVNDMVKTEIAAHKDSMMVKGPVGEKVYMTFNYPPDWASLPEDQRARITEELSLRISEQIVLMTLDWHEMMTWFGYNSWIIVPEAGSAYCYEDPVSHMVGIRAADAALRRPGVNNSNINQFITEELNAEVKRLGLVPTKEAWKAIDAVYGRWWKAGFPRKRYLQTSLPGEVLEPWLVPGFAACPGAVPEKFVVPTLDAVEGRDMSNFMHVEIGPTHLAGLVIRSQLKGKPARIIPQEHFPQILEVIRAMLIRGMGPDVDKP